MPTTPIGPPLVDLFRSLTRALPYTLVDDSYSNLNTHPSCQTPAEVTAETRNTR